MSRRRRSSLVLATSVQGGGLEKTADDDDLFLRKVWSLLVLQCSAILILTSPFALLKSFQEFIHPFHNILEIIAIVGIVATFVVGISKGTIYPFPQLCLVSITLFVSLELGLTFATASWGFTGFLALGQATTSFCVILALLQHELEWLSYPSAAFLCFMLAAMWIMVLTESGASWSVSLGMGLGAWAFVLLVLFASHAVSQHVSQQEYILAVLFILVPEALLFLGSKQRHPTEQDGNDSVDEQTRLVV